MADLREIKVFARVYPSAEAAAEAYKQAVERYIGTAVEVGFYRALLTGTGWIVVTVGPDVSESMLQGGSPVTLDKHTASVFVRRFLANRPPHGGPAVVMAHYAAGLIFPVYETEEH